MPVSAGTGQLNAYGQDFGKSFGLSKAPALVSRVLKKNEIAITEVASDNPVARRTDRFAGQDAYLVGVQLRAFPRHEYWEDGRWALVRDLPADATTFYDLKRDPVVLIDKPCHAIFSTFRAARLMRARRFHREDPDEHLWSLRYLSTVETRASENPNVRPRSRDNDTPLR